MVMVLVPKGTASDSLGRAVNKLGDLNIENLALFSLGTPGGKGWG